jgi:flagellar hook assembly protein FlgD
MSLLSTTAQASNIQMDYMKLLVTQLQNQNPLEPLNNNEMASQLAQFSQLQQLETMNASFAQVLATASRDYASSLIGKNVLFAAETDAGTTQNFSGKVEQVYNNVDGEVYLLLGDNNVKLEDVLSVGA